MKILSLVLLSTLTLSTNASLSHIDDYSRMSNPLFHANFFKTAYPCNYSEKRLFSSLLPSYVKFDFFQREARTPVNRCSLKNYK